MANGRKYRSATRRGDRYDNGTGYTTRKLRDALEEGVKQELLVWRQGQMGKEYALRMTWMEKVREDGYFEVEPEWTEESSTIWDQTVGVKDQTVEGKDQYVGGEDLFVEDEDQTVEIKDLIVGDRDQTVGDRDQTVGDRDQTVDRTYKDTFKYTSYQILPTSIKKTTTTRHRHYSNSVAADLSKNGHTAIFFRPELENGDLGPPERLTTSQAAEWILTRLGAWYWSESDLTQPDRADQTGFTLSELTAQAELDAHLFGSECALWDDGQQCKILSLVEIARCTASSQARYGPPLIIYSVWQLLDLPEPTGAWGRLPASRREFLHQLREQTGAWGDPDLITALEQINISADEARSLVMRYGAGLVGGWLRSLRENAGGVRSMAAVLISQLNKGLSPPGGAMEPIISNDGAG